VPQTVPQGDPSQRLRVDPELPPDPEVLLDEPVPPPEPLDPLDPLDPPDPELLLPLAVVWSAPASGVPTLLAVEPPQAIACTAAPATPDKDNAKKDRTFIGSLPRWN
jgi:hypothetical protein